MTASRILVVEDDALARRAYERVLSSDHDVVAVPDAGAALDELRRATFCAVVTDIDMPGLSGIELLKEVRQLDEDLPFVVVTGYPSVESAQDAVNYGAFRYFTKPVEPSALRDAVSRASRLRELGRLQRAAAVEDEKARSLAERVESALSQMWMAFQPIVSYRNTTLVGYEALLRTDEKSLARPPDFIDAAERLGRLTELGRKARAQVAAAIDSMPPDVSIFINLHARDLLDAELQDPRSPLAAYAHRVVLEITERASIGSVDALQGVFSALRAMGYRLAIDDLGAGYAGLTSVTSLEPEVVKLDMSLVRGVETNRTKQQLIASFARVCQELGMLVVTEGVETAEERDVLLGLGCDVFQGYLFGRPMREAAQPCF